MYLHAGMEPVVSMPACIVQLRYPSFETFQTSTNTPCAPAMTLTASDIRYRLTLHKGPGRRCGIPARMGVALSKWPKGGAWHPASAGGRKGGG